MTERPTMIASTPLSAERLSLLERLVAVHTENGEWQTFVALVQKAGYDVRPDGVVRV